MGGWTQVRPIGDVTGPRRYRKCELLRVNAGEKRHFLGHEGRWGNFGIVTRRVRLSRRAVTGSASTRWSGTRGVDALRPWSAGSMRDDHGRRFMKGPPAEPAGALRGRSVVVVKGATVGRA